MHVREKVEFEEGLEPGGLGQDVLHDLFNSPVNA